MSLECKNCGNGIAQGSDAELCLYSQSRLTHCKIDAFAYVREEKGFVTYVRWCEQKDKRIMYVNCNDCKYYSEEKILPEED